MALDRWIALALFFVCVLYGYSAYFLMDDLLPPIMRRSPIWPSSFPKVLAVGGVLMSLSVLFNLERSAEQPPSDINLSRLWEYNVGQAVLLLGLMVLYAILLRPFGFLGSTFLFLVGGSLILGERRFGLMALVAAIAAGTVWYLVDAVLGIFLSPFPFFLMGS